MLLSTNNDAVGVYLMLTERSDLFVVVCAIQEFHIFFIAVKCISVIRTVRLKVIPASLCYTLTLNELGLVYSGQAIWQIRAGLSCDLRICKFSCLTR